MKNITIPETKISLWWIIGIVFLVLIVGVSAGVSLSDSITSLNETEQEDVKLISEDITKELLGITDYANHSVVCDRIDGDTIWTRNEETNLEDWTEEVCWNTAKEDEEENIECNVTTSKQNVVTFELMEMFFDSNTQLFNNDYQEVKCLEKELATCKAKNIANVKARFGYENNIIEEIF